MHCRLNAFAIVTIRCRAYVISVNEVDRLMPAAFAKSSAPKINPVRWVLKLSRLK